VLVAAPSGQTVCESGSHAVGRIGHIVGTSGQNVTRSGQTVGVPVPSGHMVVTSRKLQFVGRLGHAVFW